MANEPLPNEQYDLLIVDNSKTSRKILRRQIHELLPESKIVEAGNAKEAREILENSPIDLVISELDMPEIDGFELLEWVRNRPQSKTLPFIIYTLVGDPDSIGRSVRLGATDYILKPCTSEILTHKIQYNIEKVREMILQKKEIAKAVSIPTQPQILIEINEEMNKTTPDLKKIIASVKRDAALSAKVIKIANSPFFSNADVSTIERAMNILGLKEFKNTVLISLMQNLTGKKKAVSDRFWNHLLYTAELSRFIAEHRLPEFGIFISGAERRQEFTNQAYMAGLFHDCGMLLLLDKFDDYNMVTMFNLINNVIEAEQAQFFTNHCAMGHILLHSWGIPRIICEAVRYHHNDDIPVSDDVDRLSQRRLWAVLQLADYICRFGITSGSCDENTDIAWMQSYEKTTYELSLSLKDLKELKIAAKEVLSKTGGENI
ncbi:MAG: HDOD domain-containing protein [Nitrospirae bacterium]|nr:HDOD domain-containing protein [Nitrospirota bacterium]